MGLLHQCEGMTHRRQCKKMLKSGTHCFHHNPHKVNCEHAGDEIPECPICYCTITNANKRKTSCGHMFCAGCIDKWIKLKGTCPLCRKMLKKTRKVIKYLYVVPAHVPADQVDTWLRQRRKFVYFFRIPVGNMQAVMVDELFSIIWFKVQRDISGYAENGERPSDDEMFDRFFERNRLRD